MHNQGHAPCLLRYLVAVATRRSVLLFTLFSVLAAACGNSEAPADEVGATSATSTEVTSAEASSETTASSTVETVTTPTTELLMPSLVGLQETEALELLSSVGVNDVRSSTEPSLEPEGSVLSQLPGAGSPAIEPVTLTVAAPLPVMPDYAGTRIGDARTQLEGWGVTLTVDDVLSTEFAQGEIISTTPAAGEDIGSAVSLQVVVAPVTGIPGVDADLVEAGHNDLRRPETGPIEIGGTLFENSLYAFTSSSGVDAGDGAYWEFNIGKDWEFFEATIGLVDESEFEQSGRFRVILDGASIYEEDIQFGQQLPISINISEGLRLRLEVVSLGEGRIGLAWGSAQLLGLPGVAPTN